MGEAVFPWKDVFDAIAAFVGLISACVTTLGVVVAYRLRRPKKPTAAAESLQVSTLKEQRRSRRQIQFAIVAGVLGIFAPLVYFAVARWDTLKDYLTSTSATTTLSTVGIVLLALALFSANQAIGIQSRDPSARARIVLFASLIGGILFSAAGLGLVVYWGSQEEPIQVPQGPIARISDVEAFDNLRINERVTWLTRLIPYDANLQPDLATGNLRQLGPPGSEYTFVNVYDELVGYHVDEAVRMSGGTYQSGQRVSAAIVVLLGGKVYPANARGLLQVIRNVESNPRNQITKPLLKEKSLLTVDEVSDLANESALSYWRWENYYKMYPDYCAVAQKFRCDPSYSAHNYLRGPGVDWHPLGLVQKNTPQDSCGIPTTTFCALADPKSAQNSWQSAKADLMPNFGARVFLMENLTVDKMKAGMFIDFGEPETQFIPDIGFRESAPTK